MKLTLVCENCGPVKVQNVGADCYICPKCDRFIHLDIYKDKGVRPVVEKLIHDKADTKNVGEIL